MKNIKHLLKIWVVPLIAVMGWPGLAVATTVYDAYDITPHGANWAVANSIDGTHIGGCTLAQKKKDGVYDRVNADGADVRYNRPYVWTLNGANTAITATDVSQYDSKGRPIAGNITGIAVNTEAEIMNFQLLGSRAQVGYPDSPGNYYPLTGIADDPNVIPCSDISVSYATDNYSIVGSFNFSGANPSAAVWLYPFTAYGTDLVLANNRLYSSAPSLVATSYDHNQTSTAFAVQGTNVVGEAQQAANETKDAVCWHMNPDGTLHDVVDLTLQGYQSHANGESEALGVSGDFICGDVYQVYLYHAYLWYGSFPPGKYSGPCLRLQPSDGLMSWAVAVSKARNEVAGLYFMGDATWHAWVWNLAGDESTWANSLPADSSIPNCYDAPPSWGVDLNISLTNSIPNVNWSNSCALAIDDKGDIVGYANSWDGNTHAILWVPRMGLSAVGGCENILTWNQSPNAVYYNIYRSTLSHDATNHPPVDTVYSPVAVWFDGTSWNPNTTFYYVVQPMLWSNHGYTPGNPSGEVAATTAPAAPTGLTAVGGCQSVTVSWNASAGAAMYHVYRLTPGANQYSPIATITDGTTNYTDTGLADSTAYNYTVYAANSDPNNFCGSQNSVTATTKAAVKATCKGGPNTITLSWGGESAESYDVWRGTSPGNEKLLCNTTLQTVTDKGADISGGLADNTPYYYVVVPVYGKNEVECASAEVRAKTAPAIPLLTAQLNITQVLLNLTLSPGTTTYNLLRRPSSSGSYSIIASITDGSTTYVDTGLDATTYYYAVVAVNSDGASSSNSPEVSVTPTVPAPTGLKAVGGAGQIALSWNPVAGATRGTIYHVYYWNWTKGNLGIGQFPIGNPTTTNYTDAGLADGTSRTYVVTAEIPGLGEGMASSLASATTLPSAPTGLQAVITNGQIILTWNTSTGATGYNVYRSLTSRLNFAIINTLPTPACADTGLAGGTTYYYEVTATNTAGESPYSVIVSATTPPPPPTGLTAVGGNGQVTLSWTAEGTSAQSYRVFRSIIAPTQTFPFTLLVTNIANPTAAGYTDTNVVNGTTYYYAVTAVSIFTGESTFMNVVSATPCVNLVQNGGFETGFTGWSFSGDYCNTFLDYLGQAGIPPHSGNWEVDLGTCDSDYGYLSQTLATTPGAIYLISFWVNNSFGDPNEFLVSWNGANVFGPTNLSLFATTWTNIQIQVTATNASTVLQFGFEDDYDVLGLDDVSVGLSASLTSPPAPAGLQAVPDDGQVTLTWNASPGALYYLVASGTNSGGEITYVVTFVTNYMDTNVVNGIKYYYKVLAENNSGLAYTSSEVSATPGVVAVPPAPTGLQAAATNGQVTLSWTASPHATYYLVARSTSSGTETSIMGIMTTNYTDTSVVNGTKYYYVVVSGNNLGAAYASSEVNATPVGTAVPSAPKLGGITFAGGGGGGCGFCFTNVPGASFYVYASVDLTQPFTNWTKVGTVSEVPYGAYSQYQFTDPQATTNVQRFYRVSSQ